MEIRASEVTRVFPVAITLEPMGHLTGAVNAASRFAFLKGDMTRLPWMVSLFDLLAIAEILDEPFWFPHYVKARVRLGDEGIAEGWDELDFVGEYFQSGLPYRGEGVALEIGNMTQEIDVFLYRKHGIRREKAKKPSPKLAPGMRPLLASLLRSPSPHKVEVAMALLDMARDVQRDFVREIDRRVKKARRDGKPHNHTQVYKAESGWGVTFFCTESDIDARMRDYAERKMREHDVSAWYVLGRSPTKNAPYHAFAVRRCTANAAE